MKHLEEFQLITESDNQTYKKLQIGKEQLMVKN